MLLSRLRFLFLCVFSLAAIASRAQTTINVGPNQPYATIQSGIDAAHNGDTVLVAPGTYNEHIDFQGKAITVTSSRGASTTVIDGGNTDRAVTFKSGEGRSSVLAGFTIQHGGVFSDFTYPYSHNAAVYIYMGQPTIRDNILTQNACWGIYADHSAPLIQNNNISATLDHSNCSFGGGAAIYLSGNLGFGTSPLAANGPLVIGNTLEGNVESGTDDAGGNGGAGIAVWSSSPVIMNNIIRNNSSPGGTGGAINVETGTGVVIVQNLIYNNSAACGGGALSLYTFPDNETGIGALVANNTIINNIDPSGGSFSNCDLLSQLYPNPNTYGDSTGPAPLPGQFYINNVVSGSTSYPAIDCGDGVFGGPSESKQPTFQNDILYNASGPFFGSHCVDVSSNYNNIARDPLLANVNGGNLQLTAASPAIDAGQNNVLTLFHKLTGLTLSTDIAGNPRLQGVHGQDCTIDMGAYEYAGSGVCGTAETLTSSVNPSTYNQTVTFTAQLTSNNGTPTGSVQFSDGSTVLGTTSVSSSGAATFTTSQLTVGSHTITAAFQPTGNFPASTATLTQVVNGVATSTQLVSSQNPATVGQSITFTANVTSASGTPVGSITFTDGTKILGTLPLNAGAASITSATLSAGSHQITATFTPSGAFAGSSASLSESVNGQPTTTTVAVTPNPATAFATLTLSSTVAAASGTPTGPVTFNANSTKLGSAPVNANGQAALSVAAPLPGTYNITAVYSGDAIYNGSASASVTETVTPAASATTLTASPNPAYHSQPVALSATVTGIAGQTPTGGVTFYDGSNPLGTATLSASGSASLNVSTLSVGTHTLSASYQATGGYAASVSAPVQETITPGTFGLALTPSFMTLSPGKQGTVQVTLSSVGGFSGPLQLSYAAMPTYANATLTPTTVTLTSGGSGTANLLLNASTAQLSPSIIPNGRQSTIVFATLLALLAPMCRNRRKLLRPLLSVLFLTALLTGVTGCGMIRSPFQSAAPGNYRIPVTATDSHGNSQTAILSLTVTP